MTVEKAVAKCGEIWKNMNDQQIGPYVSNTKTA